MSNVYKNLHLEHTKNQTQVTIKQTSVVFVLSLQFIQAWRGDAQDDYPGAGCTPPLLLGRCR